MDLVGAETPALPVVDEGKKKKKKKKEKEKGKASVATKDPVKDPVKEPVEGLSEGQAIIDENNFDKMMKEKLARRRGGEPAGDAPKPKLLLTQQDRIEAHREESKRLELELKASAAKPSGDESKETNVKRKRTDAQKYVPTSCSIHRPPFQNGANNPLICLDVFFAQHRTSAKRCWVGLALQFMSNFDKGA